MKNNIEKTILGLMVSLLIGVTSCKKNSTIQPADVQEEENLPNDNNGNSSEFSVGILKDFVKAEELSFSDVNAVADFYVGEHPVAIYATPTGKDTDLGKAKLIISRSGITFTMKLVNINGSVIAENAVDIGAYGGDHYKQFIRTKGSYNTTITTWSKKSDQKRHQIYVIADDNGELRDGYLSIDNSVQYRFRNNVEHFGKILPAALSSLQGIWEGDNVQYFCNPKTVTVTVTADGSINFKGKASFDCNGTPVDETLKWDGQDDFVRPLTMDYIQTNRGSQIAINYSRTIRGNNVSQQRGGALLVVPQLKNPTSFIDAQFYPDPASRGILIVSKPIKK